VDKKIVMYSTSWCGDCRRSKAWLDAHGVEYREINIEEDEAALAYVQKVNKGMNSVPTIVFPDGQILVEPTNEELEKKVKEQKLI
jgi:mycoredoxin